VTNGLSRLMGQLSRAAQRGGGHGDGFPLTRQAATSRHSRECKSLLCKSFRKISLLDSKSCFDRPNIAAIAVLIEPIESASYSLSAFAIRKSPLVATAWLKTGLCY